GSGEIREEGQVGKNPTPATLDLPSLPRLHSLPQDLSEALKEATKEVHAQAENAEFMRNFQRGQVTRKGFKLVMASLYHLYVALEEEIERNKDNPVFAPLYFPEELHRRAALEQDMAFWYGPSWQEAVPYTAATCRYVDRLQQVGRREPELLVAHAYTRYLGDLSGGQVLKKIAQKALDLPSSGEGLAFFTFPNIDSATKFKQLYRSRMNTLEMTPEVRQRVTEEAKNAFLLNIQVRGWHPWVATASSTLSHWGEDDRVPFLPLTSWVILGKSLDLSVPQFPCLGVHEERTGHPLAGSPSWFSSVS
uniref:Heme oxygenase 1 n=1 Tax=Spermophilus dauricus TaxID=99837 RepID=A0A8C9UX20_SPEDA